MSHRIPAIALVALLAAAPALAADKLSGDDRDFAKHAMADSTKEVQLGKMAEKQAQSDAVKKFAQRMVTDHGQANQKLTEIATSAGMPASTEMTSDQRKDIDKLSKLQGAEFDRAYMAAMVDDHKKDIRTFEKQADKGKDTALKSFAQETLPTLKEHLTLAQDTQAALKSGQQARTPE
jgi:putative membrane protein